MNVRLLTILEGLRQMGSDWVVAMKRQVATTKATKANITSKSRCINTKDIGRRGQRAE